MFTAKPGPTAYTRTVSLPVDAFRLILDERVFRLVKRCTVEFARQTDPNWDVADAELDTFVGLVYLRGCMNAFSFPLKLLWSEEYGCMAFRQSMTNMIPWILNRFVENSQKTFIP